MFPIDDSSEDYTGEVARRIARSFGNPSRLSVLAAEPLPPGWAEKAWALEQGVRASQNTTSQMLLFTDADICHPPDSLRTLVQTAEAKSLDMVSLMAHLRVETFWDRLLIPAFVFFFAKLFPFRWVNDPSRATAAAAGSCILIRRDALEQAGGLVAISDAMIDDCALARLIKLRAAPAGSKIWLGISPNPPKDTDGRREDSGRGWVRELQGRWPGVLG